MCVLVSLSNHMLGLLCHLHESRIGPACLPAVQTHAQESAEVVRKQVA